MVCGRYDVEYDFDFGNVDMYRRDSVRPLCLWCESPESLAWSVLRYDDVPERGQNCPFSGMTPGVMMTRLMLVQTFASCIV